MEPAPVLPQDVVTVDSLQQDIGRLQATIRQLQDQVTATQSRTTGSAVAGVSPVGEAVSRVSHLESARRDLKLKLSRFSGKLSAWHTWRQEFLSYASLYNFLPALTREPPIKTAPINRVRELEAGSSEAELAQAELAWCYLIASMADPNHKSMIMD